MIFASSGIRLCRIKIFVYHWGQNIGLYRARGLWGAGIESFWALVKRGHYGVFHWFSFKHLNRYLTEFSGRHNMKGDTLDCLGRIALGMFGKRLTHKRLVALTLLTCPPF